MSAPSGLRRLVLATLVALAHAHAPAFAAAPVAGDVEGAWATFLRTAQGGEVAAAFDVLGRIHYSNGAVEAGSCVEHATALRKAVETVPVSIALQRVSMHCAEATGDEAGAERALADLSALAAHALRASPDPFLSRPIRVVRNEDINALQLTMGRGSSFAFHAQQRPDRYFPTVLVLIDEDAGTERLLPFDLIDTWTAIDRTDPYRAFPMLRNRLVRGYVDSQASQGIVEAVDHKAWTDSGAASLIAKVSILRPAAVAGGFQSQRTWLGLCIAFPAAGCGDGLVDALLPRAEARSGLPLALLALAYHQGVGVARDPAAAERLLAAANARLPRDGGTVEFAVLLDEWTEDALPEDVQARLRAAARKGHPRALLMLLDGRGTPADVEVARSALVDMVDSPANDAGRIEAALADHFRAREDAVEAMAWTRRAAAKGNDDARTWIGFARLDGSDGEPRDQASAVQYLQDAASGGSTGAARWLAAAALQGGRASDAEKWLLPAVWNADTYAQVDYALLGLGDVEGVSIDAKGGLSILHTLVDEVPYARETLARVALTGQGMPRDVSEGRRLLEIDARKGDIDAIVSLAMTYLEPEYGPIDEAAAMRWLQPEVEKDVMEAHRAMGDWLGLRKGGRAARAQAFSHWRKASALGDVYSANNGAWEACVSGDASEAAFGREMLAAMLAADTLEWGQLDTVAACHAAAGDFADAIRVQAQAIAWLREDPLAGEGESGTRKEFEDRLALYRQGKPYVAPEVVERLGRE